MGKDKKKNDPSKIAAKKARIAAKQEKTTSKRNKKELKESGEDDIESILAEYQEKEKRRTAVAITPCSQPSPRSNFSLVSLSNNEMLLFGGEYCDGESTVVYNELFRWNIEKNEWKMIESLNTPSPRCSHQAVVFKDTMYMFGGEYATLDQFHHYRDMWALDLRTNVWREIVCPGPDAPSARSGHRMVVWRNYIVLFGGFYEALKEVRWFGDLYLFSFQDERWINIPAKPYAPTPKPRSGFLMTIHPADDAVFIFGGYSREKTAGLASSGSAKNGGKSEGKIHYDMWMLSLKGVLNNSGGAGLLRVDASKASWQKISNKGTPPTPRCGASMITYKNKGIYFGGVFDSEGPRHTLQSMFHNDLYAFDFDRKRWYALGLKTPKVGGAGGGGKKRREKKISGTGRGEEGAEDSADGADDDSSEDGGGEAEDAEERALEKVHQNGNYFGYIDNDGNIVYINIDDMEEEEEAEVGAEEGAGGESEGVGVEEVSLEVEEAGTRLEEGALEATVSNTHIHSGSEGIGGGESKGADWDRDESDLADSKPDPDSDSFTGTGIGIGRGETDEGGVSNKVDDPEDSNPMRRFFSDHAVCPVGRINAGLAIKGSTLLVYGGVTEVGDVEVTLDDCWSLDLNKRDRWKSVLQGTMRDLVWKGDIDDDGSEMTGEFDDDYDDEESDYDDEESNYDDEECDGERESDGDDNGEGKKKKKSDRKGSGNTEENDEESSGKKKKSDKKAASGSSKKKLKSKASGSEGGGSSAIGVRAEVQRLRESLPLHGEDDRLYPLYGQSVSLSGAAGGPPSSGPPIESLREFYSRSSDFWKAEAAEQWTQGKVNMDGDLIAIQSPHDDDADGEAGDRDASSNSTDQQASSSTAASVRLSEKEVKRIAFSVCQRQYSDVLPIVTALAELEESMLGAGDNEGGRRGRGGKSSSNKHR